MEVGKTPATSGGSHAPPSPKLQTDSPDADNLDSSCSTPYVSAPSSPGRGALSSFFFSAPASPMHFILSSSAASLSYPSPPPSSAAAAEFDFSSCLQPAAAAAAAGSMTSADELFHNGQIRPMELPSQLQTPPAMDLKGEDDERGRDSRLRSRSVHRRARSMSPTRKSPFEWQGGGGGQRSRRSEAAGGDGGVDGIRHAVRVGVGFDVPIFLREGFKEVDFVEGISV